MEKYAELASLIKTWGIQEGFQQVGITNTNLDKHEKYLNSWLSNGYAADMDYMSKHGKKRTKPEMLWPGTTRIISARMDYRNKDIQINKILKSKAKAYLAQYAIGRDYHKVVRSRLKNLSLRINDYMEEKGNKHFSARVFSDSAPVLEKAIAEKAGLGWIGKNTLILKKNAGSWFFLGEIFTNIPLPVDQPIPNSRCGSCKACIDVCPTRAIVAPYQLDSRKCISYHTIENRGVIPIAIREKMGNRIFGCDDCQTICPWNRYAQFTCEADFRPRNNFNTASLLSLFKWSKQEFLRKTEGSAIRRTGYDGWLRNISIALGNADYDQLIVEALKSKYHEVSDMVRVHVYWAIKRQKKKRSV